MLRTTSTAWQAEEITMQEVLELLGSPAAPWPAISRWSSPPLPGCPPSERSQFLRERKPGPLLPLSLPPLRPSARTLGSGWLTKRSERPLTPVPHWDEDALALPVEARHPVRANHGTTTERIPWRDREEAIGTCLSHHATVCPSMIVLSPCIYRARSPVFPISGRTAGAFRPTRQLAFGHRATIVILQVGDTTLLWCINSRILLRARSSSVIKWMLRVIQHA